MKRIVICMVFVLFFVWAANAQTKSMSGSVASYDASWQTIAVKVKTRKDKRCNLDFECSYIVFTRASGTY